MPAPDSSLDGFEERLLRELRERVTAGKAARMSTRRRRIGVAGIAAAGIAAAVTVPLLIGGNGASSAYAVTQKADGGPITIDILRLDDATGLENDLDAHHVHAIVDYLPPEHMCAPGSFLRANAPGLDKAAQVDIFPPDGAVYSVTVDPNVLDDYVLVIEAYDLPSQATGYTTVPQSVASYLPPGHIQYPVTARSVRAYVARSGATHCIVIPIPR